MISFRRDSKGRLPRSDHRCRRPCVHSKVKTPGVRTIQLVGNRNWALRLVSDLGCR
jgi:hypothetical protein